MNKITQRSICEVRLDEIKYTFKRKSSKDYVKSDVNWSDEQENILKTILRGGYVEDLESPPAISSDYICVDGHHRLYGLNSIHNGDHKIKVFKYDSNWVVLIFFSILYCMSIVVYNKIIEHCLKFY